MQIKKIFTHAAVIFGSANIILLICTVAILYTSFRNHTSQLSNSYLDSTFALFHSELIGDLLVAEEATIRALLFEIASSRAVSGELNSTYKFNFGNTFSGFSKTYPLTYGETRMGTITLRVNSLGNLNNLILSISMAIGVQLLILGAVFVKIKRQLEDGLFFPLQSLSDFIASGETQTPRLGHAASKEVVDLLNVYRTLRTSLENSAELYAEMKRAAAEEKIAKQVAHDIRSPLSALNMMAGSLNSLPEERRLLIRSAVQRINDIANSLLNRGHVMYMTTESTRETTSPSGPKSNDGSKGQNFTSLTMLINPIETITSEKRIQFRKNMDISINADLENGYGIFANINAVEFARVISNLINNSVEALTSGGCVDVKLSTSDNQAIVTIADNGKGIPADVLPKLGQFGLSFGKDAPEIHKQFGGDFKVSCGSGLGLHHAKTTVESFGGQLSIASQLNKGTTVSIHLPLATPPDWFIETLKLRKDHIIISVDDDQTIHQIWRERLQSLLPHNIRQLSFSTTESALSWWKNEKSNPNFTHDNFLFLVDYEFLGQSTTGLNLIESLGPMAKTILVTSRYNEDQIKDRAEQLKIKMIPKSLSPYIPVEVTPI